MKKIIFALFGLIAVGISNASMKACDSTSPDWCVSVKGSEAIFKRSNDCITFEYPGLQTDEKVLRVEAKEILFSQTVPICGTCPVQDITISTSMTYKQFLCAVVNVLGGRVNERFPLFAHTIGMLYGTTFEFENGNSVTVAHNFCAYEVRKKSKRSGPEFEDHDSYFSFGELQRPFKKIVEPYYWNILASPVKYFMGFAPLEDGIIDTTMNLDSIRKELAKLGPIKSETLDKIPLDQKFPKAFADWYRFVDANFDDRMQRKP